ncbi:MAG TPA: MEDS domain-containing protein [Bacteroidia bacterium]|nr:MEDS domain-containing protein [Bacteroidia bacterium]
MVNKYETDLQQKKAEIFWGELAPCEHLIQIYEDDDVFLSSLEAFVSAGLQTNEVAIVIATPSHLNALGESLLLKGIDVDAALEADLYIPIDASKALAKFMVYGSPDEILFKQFISGLVERANGRRIRAFGEMVALLWGQGFKTATIKLEEFWNSFCHDGALSLFCAYPNNGFSKDSKESIQDICKQHTTVVAGWNKEETGIRYRNNVHPNSNVA